MTVDLKILGCSGSAAPGAAPTTLLLGTSTAIDAGAIASSLPVEAQHEVRRVLVTHAHFDHLRDLPLLVDNTYDPTTPPLEVIGLPETLQAIREHVFNGLIWPDFSGMTPPAVVFRPLRTTDVVRFREGGASIEARPLPSYHGVPATGYLIQIRPVSGEATNDDDTTLIETFHSTGSSGDTQGANVRHALTTDTGYDRVVFETLARTPGLETLLIEVSFPERLRQLAVTSHHLTPGLLARGLAAVLDAHPRLRVLVTHLKPRFRDEIESELRDSGLPLEIVRDGDVIRL